MPDFPVILSIKYEAAATATTENKSGVIILADFLFFKKNSITNLNMHAQVNFLIINHADKVISRLLHEKVLSLKH